MNENIKNIAEIIAVSIVGDTADDEDIQSSTPIAIALDKAGYRKQSDTEQLKNAGGVTKANN